MNLLVRRLCLVAWLALVPVAWSGGDPSPVGAIKRLKAGPTEALLMVPGRPESFYRGERFDHSGLVVFLKSGAHVYIGRELENGERWFSLGTSFEFVQPVPILSGKSGAPARFWKIGVGEVEALPGGRKFRLVQAAPWIVQDVKNGLAFEQIAKAPGGLGYRLEKTVSLDEDGRLRIASRLTNTGTATLATAGFFHNWLLLDGESIGPEVFFEFPYDPVVVEWKPRHLARLDGRQVFFGYDPKTPRTHAFFAAMDFVNDPAQNSVTLGRCGGPFVEVRGDWSPFKHHLYATGNELCPEPFVEISLQPGASTAWAVTYRFGTDAAPAEERKSEPNPPMPETARKAVPGNIPAD